MTFKFIVALVLMAACGCQEKTSTEAVPLLPRRSIDPFLNQTNDDGMNFYYKAFLQRLSVLLDETETPDNQMCFRSKFLAPAISDFSYIDKPCYYRKLEHIRWMLENDEREDYVMQNFVELGRRPACNSMSLGVIFGYKLPEGWEDGDAELNLIEEGFAFVRKLFWLNYPNSCYDPNRFLLGASAFELRPKRTLESSEYLGNGKARSTMKFCYQLVKFM